jgi:hypothetical protein
MDMRRRRKANAPGEVDQSLSGKKLTSRRTWLLWKVLYVGFCLTGTAAVLFFADGILLIGGVIAMAFFVGGLYEVFFHTSYDGYEADWRATNDGERV